MTNVVMSEADALKSHLYFVPGDGTGQYVSGLMAGLRDARLYTGRNDMTGVIENPDATDRWLGALGYMAVLDQIGSCFKPKSKLRLTGNSVEKALTYFTTLQPKERKTIYALRCAFAHDYSLSNIKINSGIIDTDLTHYFCVLRGSGVLIKFPKIPWSGEYNAITPDNETFVDLEELGNLVEKIQIELVSLAEQNQLEIMLAGGSDELIQRYGFFVG